MLIGNSLLVTFLFQIMPPFIGLETAFSLKPLYLEGTFLTDAFDYKKHQSPSDYCRNLEYTLPEGGEVDPVVGNRAGLVLFCSFSATAVRICTHLLLSRTGQAQWLAVCSSG